MFRLCVSFVLVLLGSIVLPSVARAQTAVPKTIEEARRQFEAADAELNRVYQKCYVGEIAQSQDALQKAQRLWVQSRDLSAAAYQRGESGRQRHDDNYYYYALTILTQSRIKELKTLFPDPFTADKP